MVLQRSSEARTPQRLHPMSTGDPIQGGERNKKKEKKEEKKEEKKKKNGSSRGGTGWCVSTRRTDIFYTH